MILHAVNRIATGAGDPSRRAAPAGRWGNILEFQDFELITPDEREARFALGDQDLVVRQLGAELYRRAQCKTLILKLGEHGLMAFRGEPDDEEERTFFAVDSLADRVVDALGSGDASLGLCGAGDVSHRQCRDRLGPGLACCGGGMRARGQHPGGAAQCPGQDRSSRTAGAVSLTLLPEEWP